MKILRIITTAILLSFSFSLYPCISAIVSGKVTKSGRPLLWKHRDTGEENNKVEYIAAVDGRMAYVALFNASDKLNKEAWMGMNSCGFAIMNTASYNLKDDNVKEMDKEGLIMAEALGVCKSVDDFEKFIINHKKPLGVEANFGVIDASGNGAYFETNNRNFKRYNLSESESGVLVRANYSHSGRKDEGYGYIREKNAESLLSTHISYKNIEPATFTEELSRTFYHSLNDRDYSYSADEWLVDQDFIPRKSSTASCVIEGILPGEKPNLTVMWIGIGYPPCSEVRTVFMEENGVPSELRGLGKDGHSELCDAAVKMKHQVFSIKRGNGEKYLNLRKLYNKYGTGYSQILMKKNAEYYDRMKSILKEKRSK